MYSSVREVVRDVLQSLKFEALRQDVNQGLTLPGQLRR